MPDSLPVLRAERLTLRAATAADVEALTAIVNASEWWGAPAEGDDVLDDGSAFAIEVEGEIAGWLGVNEERDPEYRFASLDIVLAPAFQHRGLGPEALRAVIRWLVDSRGHHRITIDPAVRNSRAIEAYTKVGFRPVGVMRSYEWGADGTWHDNLLMDLLAEDL
jgi:aminoglycoside 6'-N-acetyltransferase